MHTNNTIAFITRYPLVGQVKTRLIPALGDAGACALHSEMALFTFNEALQTGASVQVHFYGGSQEEMQEWLAPSCKTIENRENQNIEYYPQVAGDLGEKMYQALYKSFERLLNTRVAEINTSISKNAFTNKSLSTDKNANPTKKITPISPHERLKVLLIGSDCPENRTSNMEQAFFLLTHHDVVIGKSQDGGYYLFGASIALQDIFHGHENNTDTAKNATCIQVRARAYFKVNTPKLWGRKRESLRGGKFPLPASQRAAEPFPLGELYEPHRNRQQSKGGVSLSHKKTNNRVSLAHKKKCLQKVLHQRFAPLFQNLVWSTPTVYQETVAKIKKQGLRYADLATLRDVDTAEDIPPKISVIIPAYHEEHNLKRLFSSIPRSFATEFIVVLAHDDLIEEGADKSHTIALSIGATVVYSERGRAVQLQRGVEASGEVSGGASARTSSGDILFFLHADSTIPPLWDSKIRQALANPENSLGYFTFALAEDFWTKPFIEFGTNIRSKYFKLPYGDQGLFVRRADYEKWQIPLVPILEDVYLVKTARQYGKLVGLKEKLLTSGRRWIQHGLIRVTIINSCVLLCAKLGMDLSEIKAAYWQGKNPLGIFIKQKLKQRKT